MKLENLQNELNRAKKALTKTYKQIERLEEDDFYCNVEIEDLYKEAANIESEIEIYNYLAQKYFDEVLK